MTTGLGFFIPFIEAPSMAPTRPGSTASGSDTTAIDHLRQGVEIVTDTQRFAGTLPKFETDDSEHQLALNVFGQPSDFTAIRTFEDVARFDPAVFIQNSEMLMFPVVLDNPNFEDPEQVGGFIQPLSIASRNFLLDMTGFDVHDIRAQLMDGNENDSRSVSRITGLVDRHETVQVTELFVDASNALSVDSNNAGGFFSESERILRPFNEGAYLTRTLVSGTLQGTGSFDIMAALASMSNDSDSYVPNGFTSVGVGFTYDFNSLGTDSIAFGGLKRS